MPPKTIPLDPPPLYLHKIEIGEPRVVFHSFFSEHDLLSTRELLWKWFRNTVTGSLATAGTEQDKKELADFYEHIQKLVEAAHIIAVYNRHYHLSRNEKK